MASPKLKGLVALTRPRASLSSAVLTFVGAYNMHTADFLVVARGAVVPMAAAVAAISFSQVYNDIRDRFLDELQKPGRAIPSGVVPLRDAVFLAAGLCASSLVLAILYRGPVILLVIFTLLLGVFYSSFAKNTVLVGNVTVAVASALTYWYALTDLSAILGSVALGGEIVFVYMLGHELFKTGLDKDGDSQYGVTTIATEWGLQATAKAIFACAIMLYLLLLSGLVSQTASIAFFATEALFVGVPSGLALACIRASPDCVGFVKGFGWWRRAWFLGMIALILIGR